MNTPPKISFAAAFTFAVCLIAVASAPGHLAALNSASPKADGSSHLDRALKAKSSGPRYSYQLDITADDFRGKARIHPNRPKGSRVAMITPAKSALNSEQRQALAGIDAEAEEDLWCHSFAKRIPATGARLFKQTATSATYRFAPLGDPADKDDMKIMRNLIGTVTVSKTKPAIVSFNLDAPKPFKPAIVAKVQTFTMRVRCARTPDGRTYVSRYSFTVAGSAMMQSFEERQVRTHTKLRRIGG